MRSSALPASPSAETLIVSGTASERCASASRIAAFSALALAQPDFAAHDLKAVSRIAYGGAPIAPSLVRRIQEAFPNARVGNGFGLTETSSIATFLPHEWAAEHADSVQAEEERYD